MKTKLSMAFLSAMLLAMAFTSQAFAADPVAQVTFTTDIPVSCVVHVNLFSYIPAGPPPVGTDAPFTINTAPDTLFVFFYPPTVVCSDNNTYQFASVTLDPVTAVTPGGYKSGADGTTTTVTAHYGVFDNTPPSLSVPADMLVEATGLSGAVVDFSSLVSAQDAVDGVIIPTCIPVSGSTFPLDVATLVTCTASDAHHNSIDKTFHVTVVDTTKPEIIVPADILTDATELSGALVNFSVTASDLVDGAITPTCLPASGSTFPLGTTLVSCTATDAHGNGNSNSFNVTVVGDTTPPVLNLPADIIAPALNVSGAIVNYTASADDLVDGPVPVNCAPASGSLFPIGTTTVNCSASDAHGNKIEGSFTVSVRYAIDVECGGVPGHQVLQPISADGSSVFQQGRTVPVKFRVCGTDGNSITTPGVVLGFQLINSDLEIISTTPFAEFRSGAQQWIFNLNTGNLMAGDMYVYQILLNDGSFIQFQFTLK